MRNETIRKYGEKLFINITQPGEGYLMLIVWLYFLISGIGLIASYGSGIKTFADANTRLLIGILITYISLSSIFYKLEANEVF